ncbi:hypothetical protein [Natrialba swarupiae]|uniref:Uncharacterized protein n=2 Tax=Natrialba TaxID=63742 RepID=A0A5D5AUP0_9EURY|nr:MULTISPECIES: hypothetical protein [Natrialba]MWV38627.1 hypothetical protein [Natrialba sp. INN-245]TYT62791.1 hypothetical protein FYC77_07095 [Natrialba swarupiae]
MDGARHRSPDRILLAIVLAVVVLVPLAISQLEVRPDRITVGTVVVSILLVSGSIALPALILSRWQAADR